MRRSIAFSVSPLSSAAKASRTCGGASSACSRRMRARRPSAAKLSWTFSRICCAPLGVAAPVRASRERDGGVGAPGLELERAAQRLVVAGRDELVGLGGDELVEEALDRRRRLRADELVDDLAVLEGLHRGDALDAVLRGDLLVGVGVELGEDDLALARGGGLLEDAA